MPPNLQPSVPDGEPDWVRSSLSHANGNCVDVAFRKSRHSMSNGHCAEVAFHRSARCQNGECAEMARLPGGPVLARDSKNPGPVLTFTPGEWLAFLAAVRNGEFDHFRAVKRFPQWPR